MASLLSLSHLHSDTCSKRQSNASDVSRLNRTSNDSSNISGTEIPKILHFIWLGDKSIPTFPFLTNDVEIDDGASDQCDTAGETHSQLQWNECMKSWRKHHPTDDGWVIHLWTEANIAASITGEPKINDSNEYTILQSQMKNHQGYQHSKHNQNYGMASDILRLEILNRFGGVYVDIDYWCVGCLDSIGRWYGDGTNAAKCHEAIADRTTERSLPLQFFCGASNTGCVELNNGLMACRRGGHPVLWRMMDYIHSWCTEQLPSGKAPSASSHIDTGMTSLLSSFLDTTSANTLRSVERDSASSSPMDVIEHTGPGLLTRTVCCWISDEQRKGVYADGRTRFDVSQARVYPFHAFHAFPNHLRRDLSLGDEKSQCEKMALLKSFIVPRKTVAMHLWGCSWQI